MQRCLRPVKLVTKRTKLDGRLQHKELMLESCRIWG